MKSNPTQPHTSKTSVPASSQTQGTSKPAAKQDIDAAIHQLAQFIERDPKKAAKIFESWLDNKGSAKKNVQKKSAA